MTDNRELNTSIGRRLRGVRETQGRTREQVAERADISAQFLFEIETGKKGMTARTIINLARALDISTDYLLLGEAQPTVFATLEGIPRDQQRLAVDFLQTFSLGARMRMSG
ncbi:MAG: helix-turn-helix transcriptional regulator [Selenomonadaceae bacterium]|nr:helix-turn-helix transcriptional regulator [Selenomonadaceae bacterium]